jgi:hypothetical protein
VQSLHQLLTAYKLTIPPYQRPYTWTEEQVLPLLKDLYRKEEDAPTFMGCLIFWQNGENTEIVDGQQRLTTFAILGGLTGVGGIQLLTQPFTHSVSINNIKANTKFIRDYTDKKRLPRLSFEKIYFVIIQVATLAEAFNFFDSQNNRGKKLEDTDILKAHHLRFIEEDWVATECSKLWERMQRDKVVGLNLLLGNLLGQGRKFLRKEYSPVDIKKEFKSQLSKKTALGSHVLNRYQQPPIFASWEFRPLAKGGFKFNLPNYGVEIDGDAIKITDNFETFFPFQADEALAGGEVFFLYSRKYHMLYRRLFFDENAQISKFVIGLLGRLDSFSGNTGASYVHQIYSASLLFYVDKFGYAQLDEIAAHLFFAIYWLRFRQAAVLYASVFKYVREEEGFNPFSLITRAGHPDFLIQTIEEFLEGKYDDLWESHGIRRQMFDSLISYVTAGYFSHHECLLPRSLQFILKAEHHG